MRRAGIGEAVRLAPGGVDEAAPVVGAGGAGVAEMLNGAVDGTAGAVTETCARFVGTEWVADVVVDGTTGAEWLGGYGGRQIVPAPDVPSADPHRISRCRLSGGDACGDTCDSAPAAAFSIRPRGAGRLASGRGGVRRPVWLRARCGSPARVEEEFLCRGEPVAGRWQLALRFSNSVTRARTAGRARSLL